MEGIVAQRVKSILDDRQISIAAFSKIIGMQQVTCNRQLRGDQSVSLYLLEGFLNYFPEISAEWLMRGEGGMYISSSPAATIIQPKVAESSDSDSVWKAKYDELEKRYEQLLSVLGGGFKKANVG